MAVDTQICNCNGVTMGALTSCVKAGQRPAQEVISATRAGTACGSCESMVREMVDWANGEAPRDPSSLPGSEGEHELQRKNHTMA